MKVDRDILARCAALQCTVEEAASFLKMHHITLAKKFAKDPELKKFWEEAHANGRMSLRRLQWRHAHLPNSAGVQMAIHLGKHWLGQSERLLAEHSGRDGKAIEINILPSDLNL